MKGDINIHPATAVAEYRRQGWWSGRTLLDDLEDAVQRDPARVAIVAPGTRMLYGELDLAMRRAASGLAAAGLRAGDVVSIQLPNCAEFVVLHLAASYLGAVTNPLLPNYREKELEYILNVAKTRIAVIPRRYRGHDYADMHRKLRSKLPELRQVYVVGDDPPVDFGAYEDLFQDGSVARTRVGAGEVTSLIFTSGTESTPKGVVHSHETMLYGTRHMASLLGLTAHDVVWVPSPVGHGTGFQWGVRQAITLGATMVLQDHWDPFEALHLIARERCSFVLSATPFVQMLLDAHTQVGGDVTSLRIFGCAGAPIPRQLGTRARTQMGCNLIGMWGMTECFVGSASAPEEEDAKLWMTDGHAMPHAELAIFDESRTRQLAPGEIGELATRGPHVALGYFNDPARTLETFSGEGWLFSNDLATLDEDGYIRIAGRKKDIINRGGLKVSSREIEDLLIDHPGVASAALVAVPDDRLGEKGCICVVPRAGGVSLSQLTEFLLARGMAKYKLPEFLALIDEMPMTSSGKVQKFTLRDGIRDGKIRIADAP